jgi:hypothetical protein
MLVVSGFLDKDARFIPDSPITLPAKTRVKITVEENEEELFARQTAAIEESIRLLKESEDEALPDGFPNRIQWFRKQEEARL